MEFDDVNLTTTVSQIARFYNGGFILQSFEYEVLISVVITWSFHICLCILLQKQGYVLCLFDGPFLNQFK